MKEIILINNKGSTLVDNEDYEWLLKYRWRLCKGYAVTSIKNNNKWKTKRMHRLIMKEPKNMEIDHIDRNGLNNIKSNLRIVTRQQNSMNRVSFKNSSSKFKGICLHKVSKKWQASIEFKGKVYYLGSFNNEDNAARAYNKKQENYLKNTHI